MKRRRRFRKTPTAVSLFPFLAVLICTMGALIALLVMGVQQARVQANQVADQREEAKQLTLADREKTQLAAEDAQWRWELLVPQRDEKNRELAEQRLKLGHVEEHIRSSQAKARRLLAELQTIEQTDSEDLAAKQRLLADKQRQIELARQAIAVARDKLRQGPRSFSIIPYRGPNGTLRRPIFVECTKDGILIQPEGILLKRSDFEGPMGPGNPLAAALRAIRDHWVRTGVAASGEPYPLLIVRPDGAFAYSIARQAMKSWQDEFGYELVDGEKKLAFPKADPQLRPLLEQTVNIARKRQAMLAAASPSLFASARSGGRTMRASRSRGFVADRRGGQRRGAGPGHGGLGSGQERRFDDGFGDSSKSSSQSQSEGTPADGQQARQSPGGAQSASRITQSSGSGQGTSSQPGEGRENDWGLPKIGSTPVTRQVRIACDVNRLLILPRRGESYRPRVVRLTGPVEQHVDQFVSELWSYMDDWGIALAGGYWKPVLVAEVAPGAEGRFRQLQQSLRNSGLELTRKQTP